MLKNTDLTYQKRRFLKSSNTKNAGFLDLFYFPCYGTMRQVILLKESVSTIQIYDDRCFLRESKI